MNRPISILFLFAVALAAIHSKNAASADAEQATQPQRDYTSILKTAEDSDALDPVIRDGIMTIVNLAKPYANCSDAELRKLLDSIPGSHDKGREVTVTQSDGSKVLLRPDETYGLSARSVREDKLNIAINLERPVVSADEAYLKQLPGRSAMRESEDRRWLIVTVQKTRGAQITYYYNRQEPSLSWTKVIHPSSGFSTRIGCDRRERGNWALQDGWVALPNGEEYLRVFWRQNSGIPAYAVQGRLNRTGGGRFIAWNANGKMIANMKVDAANPRFGIEGAALPLLDAKQFDALELTAYARLRTHPIFMTSLKESGIDGGAQDAMKLVVEQCDPFLHVTPGDVAYLYHWGESKVIKTENAAETSYRHVTNGLDPDWNFVFNAAKQNLKRVESRELALYFDSEDVPRLIGGRMTRGSNTQWLISFYSGKNWPRLVVAATTTPPPMCLANGMVYVWSPAGDKLLEQDVKEPTALSATVESIDSALTSSQKAAIAWRGAKEADYLLGSY